MRARAVLRWTTRGSVTVGVLAACLVLADVAETTPRGVNGRIAYVNEVADKPQLFTIRPDGTERARVRGAVRGAGNPDWAPDGRSIVAEVETASGAGVSLIAPDGSTVRNLTPKGYQGQPSFSPDGRWIVLERDPKPGDNGVWLMRRDGSGLRRLTRNPFMVAGGECGCDTDPNFSPNGRLITFVRVKQDELLSALFVTRRDGTGLRQLTPYTWGVGIKHDWSPDGRRIVLTVNAHQVQPDVSANIVTIRPDGSGRVDLTRFTGGTRHAFAGSFSPDGKQIALRLEDGGRYSLAVMDTDGRNVRKLFTGSVPPVTIDWGTGR